MSWLRHVTRWPLQFFVPAMLLAISLVVTMINFGAQVEMQRQAMLERESKNLRHELHQLANLLEHLSRKGDIERVRHEVAELGAKSDMNEAWVADDDGRVIAATRMERVGKPVHLPNAVAGLGLKQKILIDGIVLDGYQALVLNHSGENLHRQRNGMLYIGLHLSDSLAMARATAWREAVEFGLFSLLLAVLLWLYFTRVLGTRLRQMESAAQRLGAGQLQTRIELEGNDELASVGKAFDQMAGQLEKAWEESKYQHAELAALMQALNEHATVSIADANGDIQYVNDKFCQITGYSRDEIIGKNHRVLKSGAHSDEFYGRLWQSMISGRVWQGQVENRRKDGKHFWVETTNVPVLDAAGKPLRFISVRTDVTRLERLRRTMEVLSGLNGSSEQAYERLAEAVSIALDSRWAGISLFEGSGEQVRTLAFWADGAPADPFSYTLAGTPCAALVSATDQLVVADRVTELYPNAPMLKQLGARSYVGETLFDSASGKAIGFLFAIDTVPYEGTKEEQALLRLIAKRTVLLIEQTKVEQQLMESEMRFRKLFEDSAQATLIIENDEFIDCNRAALVMMGMNSKEQLSHVRPSEISPEFQPDGRLSELKAPEMINLAFENGSHIFEWEHVRFNGEHFMVEVLLTPISFSDRKLLHVAWRDITDRKRASDALKDASNYTRSLIEANLDPLVTISPDGKIMDVNHSTELATGLMRSELIGSDFSAYFTDPDKARAGYRQVLEKGEVVDYPLAIRHVSGSVVEVLYNATLYYDALGNMAGVFASARDISDRKRLEAEQDRLRGQLQQAQKMEAIGQLTGGIAHDFNNILAAILGYTGLALDRFVPDKESKLASYLKEVQTAGERARDLIAKMLAFSRGAKGESVALDAPPLVKEVVKTLRSVIPSTIELDAHIEEHLPAILSDPVQLHQVIMNLAINARDAIGEHGRIEIGLHNIGHLHASCDSCHHDIDGEYVELSFSDTGSGIPPEILRRIFDPFFTTKEVGKGTGMGLSMVHGIMHEHGGHIRVHSVPGKGTTFRLLFPIALARQTEAEPQLLSGKTNVRASARILVVDDESTVGRMLGEVLEAHGHQPTVLTGGAQALAVFESDPQGYDLVISDQTMPGMSGSELAQQLLAIRPDLPIFLCTGYSDTIDAEGAKKIGVRHLFQKPLASDDLLDKIADAMTVPGR